jgi:hypothetical protein
MPFPAAQATIILPDFAGSCSADGEVIIEEISDNEKFSISLLKLKKLTYKDLTQPK